ncbi:tyrosine-type recombinase/integrase [Autumnicola psychrophila]|uniref:Tyrosine recombinase XerC n=1 Tax=Autumnicola psychrophila TaxID=3075592 RepID=A0ABU3DSW9_9FLAO|nr:tyrosine-type recombinase/integrase [Zunongwangia sp. F225]MDT0686808.1 tyrosine-type recombinase/integrase [Zunongwangia sp. F225]
MSYPQFFDYLQLEKNFSAHTVKAYKKDLELFSEFVLAEYEEEDISGVSYQEIRSWIVQLVDSGISNRSINRKISSLKAYYRFLLKTKQIEFSPLAMHRALKTGGKVQVPFSELEVENVLDAVGADDFSSIRDKLIVELLYSTGIRRNELIELRLDDVDLRSRMLKVFGKRNKERYLPLLPSVLVTIEIYLEKRRSVAGAAGVNYLLLTNRGKKLYESFVYRLINNYFSKVSGKLKRSPHILRHSFATHLLNQGANLNAVKELLGHSSLASTQIYTHNNIAELSKVHQLAHPRNKKD